MSATVININTNNYYDGGIPPGFSHMPRSGNECGSQDIQGGSNMPPDQVASWINNLPVPDSIKNYLRNMMGVGSEGALPSDASAAKTINQFQKDNNIGLLSVNQMQQMAESGYYTDKSGKSVEVSPDVQQSAQAFMANNGALFKKMESATDGKHDGQLGQGDYDRAVADGTISSNPNDPTTSARPQVYGLEKGGFMSAVMNGQVSTNRPSEYGAAKTMNQFQQDNNIGLLNIGQMHQIAETGYFTDKDGKTQEVSPKVQAAAQTFMENNAELFKKMESATDGKHDGQLGQGDFNEAVSDGTIAPQSYGNNGGNGGSNYNPSYMPPSYQPGAFQGGSTLPSEASAATTMQNFQKDNNIGLMSAAQMKQIADTGYYTNNDGKSVQVSPDVQKAAQSYMANDGAMFKKVEAATDGQHDGQLGMGDPDEARKKGIISYGTGGAPVVDQSGNYGSSQTDDDQDSGYGGSETGGDDYQSNFPGSYSNGGQNATPLPSAASAATTMQNFQKDNNIGLMSASQMKQIADTGYYTDNNGKSVQVSPDVQQAAQAYMANNGALFKQVEAATDGQHDGQLGMGDPDEARKKGIIATGTGGAPVVDFNGEYGPNGGNQNGGTQNGGSGNFPGNFPGGFPTSGSSGGQGASSLPSASSAATTMQDFQKANNIGLISADQMKQIADTGYYTNSDGKSVLATPNVQKAAQAYMANDGALFKQVEAATDGKNDGQLGMGDPDEARKKGIIDTGTGGAPVVDHSGQYGGNPPPFSSQPGGQGGYPGGVPGGYPNGGQGASSLPSPASAVDTMQNFQKNNDIGLLSASQMKQIADTGYYTNKDGKSVEVSPQVQNAAKTYMADGGALFKQVESATNGKHDGELSAGDADQARTKGLIPA